MPREVLQIALGSSACEVAAHSFNLQGLSVTPSGNDGEEELQAHCEAGITHWTDSRRGSDQQLWVPRALMVDEPSRRAHPSVDKTLPSGIIRSDQFNVDDPLFRAAWKGRVERLDVRTASVWGSDDLGFASLNSNDTSLGADPHPNLDHALVDPRLAEFWNAATTLAHSNYSRYHAARSSPSQHLPHGVSSYKPSESNARHVNWDDMDDEYEEEEELDQDEYEEEREQQARVKQRQKMEWSDQVYHPLQSQLEDYWMGNGAAKEMPEQKQDDAAVEPNTCIDDTNLSWMDYWMPPYHPKSLLSLPVSTNSGGMLLEDEWDCYWPVVVEESGRSTVGSMVEEWREDQLLERTRAMLEDCDACQGMVLSSTGHGIHAGLTTRLLQYFQEECPAARRLVLSITDDKEDEPVKVETSGTGKESSGYHNSDATSWRTRHVQRVRRQVGVALAWHDHTEEAHAVLPLRLGKKRSRFQTTAQVAAALESATLPFRLASHSNPRARVGLNSYYHGTFSGESPFGSARRLSFAEFLGNLQPNPNLSVLELDAFVSDPGDNFHPGLWPRLLEGTSLERDRRIRESPHLSGSHRPRDVLPGAWMLDREGSQEGGRLLSSLSPAGGDRSLHKHFALSAAVRPDRVDTGVASLRNPSNYVDCLVQGMGIRYRPEQSVATVLGQSLTELTTGGYGAGSYWKSALGRDGPVLSVLGNTTRFYPIAHSIAMDLKQGLSPRSRGYYNRDVLKGMLPEAEDCQGALESLLDLRDLYSPPHGSGLLIDEEGSYFDIG